MTASSYEEADLERVLAMVDSITSSRQESLLWLRQPLKAFNGLSPENLVAIGRTDDVIGYLSSLSSGFVG